MDVLRKYNVIAPAGVAIAFLIAGGAVLIAVGSQTKGSQCQRLITSVNQVSSLIERNKGQNGAKTLQLAFDLDKVSDNLAGVYLGDEELKKYRQQFVKVFDNLSDAIAKAGKALNSAEKAEFSQAGRAKVEKAKVEIEAASLAAVKAANQTEILAREVNQYCST